MASDLFKRYIWLADTIYRSGRISFEEISKKWENSDYNYGEELSLRTFHNHRKAVESLFDIDIECDKKNGYLYYVANADDIKNNGVRNWLLDTFAVSNLINESHHLKERIMFEEIPSGRKYLTQIIEAMRDELTLSITYKSFKIDQPNEYVIEPYCVKVFKQRWYLVGRDVKKDVVHIYGLDRIYSIKTTDIKFVLPEDFSAESIFANSFGITISDTIQPEVIRIKANPFDANYFRALPLHHSQREISKSSDFSIFELYLIPTYDFYQEILSFGDRVEIISPDNVRDSISNIIRQMHANYKL